MSAMSIRLNPGNLQSSEALVAWTERRVQSAMRRFSSRVTRIEVHVADLNGPRGGSADLRCAMEARINGRKPLAVEHRAGDLYAAINGAARKLRAAACRAVDRVKDRAHRISRRRSMPATTRPARFQTLPDSSPRDREAHQAAIIADRGASASAGSAPPANGAKKHVIIAGFGPVGRRLADILGEAGVPVTIIDSNARTVGTQESLGRSIVHGDTTDPGVLVAAGLRDAVALAITIPDGEAASRASQVAKSLSPAVFIAARTRHLSEALRATQLGADAVTVEELVTEQMATAVSDVVRSRVRCACEGAD
jgi:ribosome-associated translation inhibitor RaiA